MKVKINDKEYEMRELTYLEVIEIEEIKQKSISEAVKTMLSKSTGLSDEEITKLTVREGTKLQEEINKINGFQDFQTPVESKE